MVFLGFLGLSGSFFRSFLDLLGVSGSFGVFFGLSGSFGVFLGLPLGHSGSFLVFEGLLLCREAIGPGGSQVTGQNKQVLMRAGH